MIFGSVEATPLFIFNRIYPFKRVKSCQPRMTEDKLPFVFRDITVTVLLQVTVIIDSRFFFLNYFSADYTIRVPVGRFASAT